jgi:hypothetical protein
MTIPVSSIVNVIPGVVNAGGNALVLNGLMMTTGSPPSAINGSTGIGRGWLAPIGVAQPYTSAAAVGSIFGINSNEYYKAVTYFSGYQGMSQVPGTLLIGQFAATATPAWLRGAAITSTPIATLASLTGTIGVVVDNYAYTSGTLNLSAATSYSLVASALQTALNTTLPAAATSAAAGCGIAATTTSTFNGYIAGNVLFVTSTPSNPLYPGATITIGAAAGTMIQNQLSGTNYGIGSYVVSGAPQNIGAATAFTATYSVMTLTGSNVSGNFAPGQTITGGTILTTGNGTQITFQITGTGGAGTYVVSPAQGLVASCQAVATGSNLAVNFDQVTGSLIVTSGQFIGSSSTMATAGFTGTAATVSGLGLGRGAIVSQGSPGVTPSAAMTAMVASTQNWASFFTLYDPDGGTATTAPLNGPISKCGVGPLVNQSSFAYWTSSLQSNPVLNRYVYLAWDTDPAPTNGVATSSMGYLCQNTYNLSGICPIYDPNNLGHAAFVSGSIAAINFQAVNGRTTMAFRTQQTIQASVQSGLVASNLQLNSYNYVGAYATANQGFVFLYPGSVTGPFAWLDSYVNQIYMNAQFQLDLIELLVTIPSIPYNAAGYAMVEAALYSTIQQMLNFGAIRAGVPLSTLQQIAVDNQAGIIIDPILSYQGWYVQVQPASAQTRGSRLSPTVYFWYTDGQSIQNITLNSEELM